MVVVAGDRDHRDLVGIAQPFDEVLAARTEIAALRPLVRQRQLAGDRDQRARVLVGAGQRDRAEQALRIGVAHPVEHILDRTGLDRFARIHHRDAVAGLEDQPEIVRHEDHRRAEFLAEPLDQLDDAGLDGNVERRRRLVEQEQRRLRQQRHGDHDALLLAAGELVRIGAHHALGIRQADGAHGLQRALVGLLLRHLVVQDRHFHQLLADLHGRVQAGHRLLVDHGDLIAADGAELLRRQFAHVLAFELDAAADDLPDIGEVAHDAERHGRLAAAGFADDAHRLARQHRAGKVHDGRVFRRGA